MCAAIRHYHHGEEMVRKALSVLAIATVALATVTVPTGASAAAPPVVQFARSDPNDLGRIQVSASAEAGVAGIVAHVIAPETNGDVADVSDFTLVSGNATQGIWESGEVSLANLDFYRLNVDVTDSDGVTVTQVSAGQLTYCVQMFYAGLSSTTLVTYGQRDFNVSGQLMGRWPGSQATQPLAGFQVEFWAYDDFAPQDTTSGPTGQFSFTTQVQDAVDTAYVTTIIGDPDHPFYLQAYADLPAPKITPAATQVTMTVDHSTVQQGDPMTVSGVLTWQSPDGWQPMADMSVAIGLCQSNQDPAYCAGSLGTTTTDDQGHYSIAVDPSLSGTLVAVVYNPDPFVTTYTIQQMPITVIQRSSFAEFEAVRDTDNNRVFIGGQLEFTLGTPVSASVSIQVSATGTNGWHTVDTIDLLSPTDPFGKEYKHPSFGYWRAVYAGQPGAIEGATSPVVRVP